MLAGASTFGPHSRAQPYAGNVRDRTSLETAYPDAAPSIEAAFRALLEWMCDKGWRTFLKEESGFDIDLSLAPGGGDAELFRELAIDPEGPFREFAGKRAIQPGDPAMSLLYHALAASEIVPPGFVADEFASPSQLDALENYIFERMHLDAGEDLEPAIFAYEYRQAFKTPHRRHSDLVYARTGVARTGTLDCVFDAARREYSMPAGSRGAKNASSVVPARFGLFLARRVDHRNINRIGFNSIDDQFEFLLPVCKLSSGSRHINRRGIQFSQSHRDEKLARLMEMVRDADVAFDLDTPPFLRISMTSDGPLGSRPLKGHDSELVSICANSGSAVIFPVPAPIVKAAYQGEKRARFRVPPFKEMGGNSNRRYTTLKLLEKPFREVIDFVLSDFIFGGGRHTTGFRSPRNGPVFVNIREEVLVSDDGKESVVALGMDAKNLEKIRNGGYLAGLFQDGLCDGCVTAEFVGPENPVDGDAKPWLEKQVLPAISIVAAPDFFPRFDPIDLQEYDDYFLEGGTETASGLRLPGNPRIELPGNAGQTAFPVAGGSRIADTITAVVSAPACSGRQAIARGYSRHGTFNTLTDTISNVFAPGWDITYSNVSSESGERYIATFGLGSPFPEDMKLCAAANGMWAGSSPDASRTFYPGIEPIRLLGRPATAVPLLDQELGFHEDSPAVREHRRSPLKGWDGEFGPFIRISDGRSSIEIDYADIMLSDYVQNAKNGLLDLGRMQALSHWEVVARIRMLGACIRALPRSGRVRSTDLWLISAEAVPDWFAGAKGLGLPALFGGRGGNGRISAAPGMQGSGWLFAFAHCPDPAKGSMSESGRLTQQVRRLYLCQGDAHFVRYARLHLGKSPPAELGWSRPTAL